MTFEKNIPNATVNVSLYYRIFKWFHRENIIASSKQITLKRFGIDPATVRRDFSLFWWARSPWFLRIMT